MCGIFLKEKKKTRMESKPIVAFPIAAYVTVQWIASHPPSTEGLTVDLFSEQFQVNYTAPRVCFKRGSRERHFLTASHLHVPSLTIEAFNPVDRDRSQTTVCSG